jgi:hypothetical protein
MLGRTAPSGAAGPGPRTTLPVSGVAPSKHASPDQAGPAPVAWRTAGVASGAATTRLYPELITAGGLFKPVASGGIRHGAQTGRGRPEDALPLVRFLRRLDKPPRQLCP